MVDRYNLHFISIEGNWDEKIHKERIDYAAKLLLTYPESFAVASGTYAPEPYSSFYSGPLGRYTSDTLINKYNIEPERVIPAYLFSEKFSYTIMDAYTNATLIGWVCCGFKRKNKIVDVLLEPCTSHFHGLRVELLNIKSCHCLCNLNVNVTVRCKNKINFKDLGEKYQDEVERIMIMQKKHGVLSTGEWFDTGVKKSLNNVEKMNLLITNSFERKLNKSMNVNVTHWSSAERLLFLMAFNLNEHCTGIDFNTAGEILKSSQKRYGILEADKVDNILHAVFRT